jgi:PKD repeat protein
VPLRIHWLLLVLPVAWWGCNDSPSASFTYTPSTGQAPLRVAFDASASSDPDGQVIRYDWDFGDGQTGSGVVVEHTYANAATFAVRLTVTDNDGAKSSVSQTLNVSSSTTPRTAVLTPEGGRLELEGGVVLEVPAGAVGSPTEIQWRLLQEGEVNRALYAQYMISQHWAGREIQGVLFTGNPPYRLVAGIEIEPTGISLQKPIAVTLPASPFYQPYRALHPAHVWISGEGELDRYTAAPIDIRPTGLFEIPGAEEPVRSYSVTFNLSSSSKHAVIDREVVSSEEISECDVPETSCRCGRILVETGGHDYSNEECTLSQSVVRVTFLDCPSQPVEESQEVIPTAGCEDVEPIPDLLNYRPGKEWSFSLSRVQLTPRDEQWEYGNHRAAVKIQATFHILPEMNAQGQQSLSGSASAWVEGEVLPVTNEATFEGQYPYQCTGARFGPLSTPVDFTGTMDWDSPSRPPSLVLTFVIHEEGVGIVRCRSYAPDAEWHEEEIGLAYVRTYGFGAVPFAPFSGTWECPSGQRTPDHPWWFLLMMSYPSFSSTENVSLVPF